MINNGGYAVVDCTGVNLLAQASATVTGLYAKCKAAYDSGKPILAINCEYGTGVHVTPFNVFGIIESGVYIFTSSILQVRVDSDDSVTIVNIDT